MSFTTIHFDASDYCGTDFDARRVKLWATNNAEDETIHDPDGHVYIGSGNGTIAADGQASITVPVPEAGWNPITCQTTLHLDYPDRNSRARNGRETKTFGPFTVPEGSIAGLITNVALTSNVASLTTSAAHGLRVGYTVTVSGDSAPFNGTHVITEVTSTVTFKAVIVATDVASRAAAALFSSNDIQLNDLVEEQAVPPVYLSQVTAQLEAIRDEALAGGGGSLTVVSGGTVDLDDTKADGYLIGYKVTATTTIEGVSFEVGSYIFERDSTVGGGWSVRTIDAGDSILPPDITDPTAGTLSATTTATTADILVSGAMDETALHATPYRFSKDNGSTYSAWQAGNTYQYTGLTSATSYPFKHEVRDAALNVKAGAAVSVSTSALLAWSTLVHEVTTRPNATVVSTGTAPETTTGGATFTASTTFTSNGTKLVSGAGGMLSVPYADTTKTKTYRVSADYDITSQAGNVDRSFAKVLIGLANPSHILGVNVDSSGAVTLQEGTVYTYTTTVVNAVTAGLTGNITAELDTTNGTVRGYHNGTHAFTAVCDATFPTDISKAAWQVGWSTHTLGNLKFEVYS
jgi:hypothetical protein